MNKEDLKILIKNVDSQLYELLSNLVCSICQELLTKPVTTPCRHSFCSACIKRVLSSKDNSGCPLCKSLVKRYGLEEDKVKFTLSKICQELPTAFVGDVKDLTADFKDLGDDLVRTSKLSQFKQESPKDEGRKMTTRKSGNLAVKRTAKEQKSDSGSFTPVLKYSENVQEYVSAKRRRIDDLLSVSQTEPASSSNAGEPTELDKKLQNIEKIPAEEKVKEWFNAIGDNIYINSPISESDRTVEPFMEKRDHNIIKSKPDPYEFVPSQNVRKSSKKTRKKTTKRIPDFQALQSFTKESIRRSKMVQDSMEDLQEERESPVEMNLITASQKFDQLLSETKHKPHVLYSASLSSSPNFLDVSLHSKLEEKKKSSNELDDILFKDMDAVDEGKEKRRPDPPKKKQRKSFEWKKQTRLGELLHELVNDDIIYGTQPVDAPLRLQPTAAKGNCTFQATEKTQKLDALTQKSALIGFDVQETSLDELMFKQMVENMERELNSQSVEKYVKNPKRESFVAFNLIGKIRQSQSTFIEFLQLGRLTPTRTRARSTVVKVVFPIGLASLARRLRRTTRKEISIGIQTSQRMVSSVAQTSQVEPLSANIQTSQEVKPSAEIQKSQKYTSTEIQTTQRQKSCEVQTSQIGCSAQVQTSQIGCSAQVQTSQIGCSAQVQTSQIGCSVQIQTSQKRQSCEVQTTQISFSTEVQTTEAETQGDVNRSPPRKPARGHHKLVNQISHLNEPFSNGKEVDLKVEFDNTWQKTQKPEVTDKDDSDDSDIQPLKRRTRVLSDDSLSPKKVIKKYETRQKVPVDIQKLCQDEEGLEVIDLWTPKESEGSQNSEEQMVRVLKNINLDLPKSKKEDVRGEKSEESDSDFFVEQTPPKTQRVLERMLKEKTQERSEVIDDSLPKGFSESFLMLTAPEKRDENDQNQLNANREAEAKSSQLKAVVEEWKHSEPKTGKKFYVVASSIKNPELIRKFTTKFKFEFSSKPTKDMTHLIVGLHKNEEKEELPLCTPKLLFAMANKKWVVSELWAESCLKMNVILPEENFETLDPIGGCGCKKARVSTEKLLRNCEIHLLGGFQTITKEEFSDLIIDCGGTIVSSPEKFSYLPSRLRMIIADRDCLKMDETQIKELFEKYSTVVLSRDVIIMSIQSYTLANFSSYLLHPAPEKVLVKLGYPHALVRSDDDD